MAGNIFIQFLNSLTQLLLLVLTVATVNSTMELFPNGDKGSPFVEKSTHNVTSFWSGVP